MKNGNKRGYLDVFKFLFFVISFHFILPSMSILSLFCGVFCFACLQQGFFKKPLLHMQSFA